MLRLEFRQVQANPAAVPGAAEVVGPAPAFRISGNFIRALPSFAVVAEYIRHRWSVRGDRFARYDCHGPLKIYFLDALDTRSAILGPFEHVFTADSMMSADGRLFAKFIDETVLWHSFVLETYWPNLILEPA